MNTSKPTVRIGDRYEFSCDDGENTTVGTLAGTRKFNSLCFEMMEGRGHWTQININDKWLSANDVTVLEYAPLSPKKPADQRSANEDSESIRSAETIQSLREENANMLRQIRKLELTIDIYETAFVCTGNGVVLGAAQRQVNASWERKMGGAK